MTLEELQALVPEWQQRLRLQDWEIVVEYVRKADTDAWWGELTCRQPALRYARIRIVDPRTWIEGDYPRDGIIADPECALVHELCHIYTEGILGFDQDAKIERGDPRNVWAEQMADAMARAMIGLKRKTV